MTVKYDGLMYERVYNIFKNKIECGIIPAGTKLPSRGDLCQEFGTSEKTIRRVLTMLEENGFIETQQRKRPVVSAQQNAGHQTTTLALEKIDTSVTDEVIKTGVLLCYPLIKNGISLCEQEDFEIPRKILENMKVEEPEDFWRLSKQLWRFFVARNGNDLSLRLVESLGLADLKPLQDNRQIRARYYGQLQEFMGIIERGEEPERVQFDDMSGIYGFTYGSRPAFQVPSESTVILGRKHLEKLLKRAEVRYSAVYMDLLGLIAVGRYQPGDKLPTHKELQEIYHVSVDTTVKAMQILQEWGVVKAVRGNGIFVEMDITDLKKIEIPSHLIACHVRRYLDTLELLCLTVEGVAACAAEHATAEDIKELETHIDELWNVNYLYERTPAILLQFITDHVKMDTLSAIYTLLQQNFRIGRSIPALVNTKKIALNCEIHDQCLKAVALLAEGKRREFSEQIARLFTNIYSLVAGACKRLDYYEAAVEIYDGKSLWK